MASLTVTNYSDEMTTLVTNKKFLNSSVTAGKAKIASFSFTNGATAVAIGGVILLAKLPASAKILTFRADSSNATASSTLAIGYTPVSALVDTNAAALVAATSTAAAATLTLATGKTLTEPGVESYVFATVAGATFAANATLKGYIVYTDNES